MKLKWIIILIAFAFTTNVAKVAWAGLYMPDGVLSYFGVMQIYVSIEPIYPNWGGYKFIIEPVKVENEQKVLHDMSNSLQQISQHLKTVNIPVTDVVIVPALFTRVEYVKDSLGNTNAWFSSKYKRVCISYHDYLIGGEEALKSDFGHELGHIFWYYVLTPEQKEKYIKLTGGINNQEHELAIMYSLTDRQLLEEWFAEEFRFYACGIKDVKGVTSRLGKSHGDPEALQTFFNAFSKR